MSAICALTVDVHGIGPEAVDTPEAELFGRFAHGRYAYNVGLGRLLDMLARRGLTATFFWPATEVQRVPDLFDRCVAEGHEIGANGWAYERPETLNEAAEARLLERAHRLLADRTGRAPRGFRAPTGMLSQHTLRLLAGLGYRYDSSFIDDDTPYPLDDLGGTGMVELPRVEGLDDAEHFGRRLPQGRAELFFNESLDALLAEVGFACLTLHPRGDEGVGRLARLAMIERVLDRAVTRFGATILPAGAAIELWSAQARPGGADPQSPRQQGKVEK